MKMVIRKRLTMMSFDHVLKMVMREQGDILIRPVLFKFGVALAISFGGILYTYFKIKRIKPPDDEDDSQLSPGNGNQQLDSRMANGETCNVHDHYLQDSSPRKAPSQISTSDLSSSGRYSADKDVYLLPEFEELVKECDITVSTDIISPQSPIASTEHSARESRCTERDESDREIKNLRDKIRVLEERERNLEIQLLEYYGLKEQEAAVMELQNRLRLNNMEVKLYNLKIESLQTDNKRLEAKVSEHSKVVAELESAKAKIKVLRKKLRSEAEQNRDQILVLQERVMKLQRNENRDLEIDRDLAMEIERSKEIKEELDEMKRCNQCLKNENSDLAQKLEYSQMLAKSALDNEEAQELREEASRLKKQHEDLSKEIEQLKADRLKDVEELVYLRWINACLRYELRNYEPIPGTTIARDLSKSLSPKSEEKAKSLILEYANKENSSFKGRRSIVDFDCENWSSSHDYDESSSSVDTNRTNHSSKSKVFGKLMSLMRGKSSPRHNNQTKTSKELKKAVSLDDNTIHTSRCSSDSSRRSFDLSRSCSRGRKSLTGDSSSCSRRTSDCSSLSIYTRINSITEDENDWSPSDQDHSKNELLKYGEALRSSRERSPLDRRSASYFSG